MVATAAVAAEALVEVDEVVGGGGKVAAKVAVAEVMLVGSELENSNAKSTMGVDNS